MNNLRQAAQQALEALEAMQSYAAAERKGLRICDEAIADLKQALAEPEQPVAWLYRDSWGTMKLSQIMPPPVGAFPVYTAPTPQREHITDGPPCWCNPDVIEEDGGNVIVHNYEDNWQQYAKPGETAQQCIERHRSEQDALMKLYATPRKPLTDEEIVDIWAGVSMGYDDEINIIELARAVIAAYEAKQGEQT